MPNFGAHDRDSLPAHLLSDEWGEMLIRSWDRPRYRQTKAMT